MDKTRLEGAQYYILTPKGKIFMKWLEENPKENWDSLDEMIAEFNEWYRNKFYN